MDLLKKFILLFGKKTSKKTNALYQGIYFMHLGTHYGSFFYFQQKDNTIEIEKTQMSDLFTILSV